MADQDRLVKTLIELIQIDSPSGEEDAMDLEVSSRLESMGLEVSHDSYNNVIAKLEGKGKPVMLSAHLDTVEPGRGINPVIDGGVLRSDGTTILGGDCKAGVAIVLEGLKSALMNNNKTRAIEVVFTRHEEGGLVFTFVMMPLLLQPPLAAPWPNLRGRIRPPCSSTARAGRWRST